MSSEQWFTLLVGLVALERLAELVISTRNARAALARGGVESGQGHYRPMVLLHIALLAGALAEVWWLDRPWVPALGWSMLAAVLIAQGLRWWCILVLGRAWNTRVIVVPGGERVERGPYRWLPHPNYVAVVLEGVALPLVHGAWVTAAVFTVLNAWLLTVRIRVEDRALRQLT
ncbi:isoprenylcysteine carboxyl methyltransferase family protein [Ornithinimicrobium pratense]|uniref:Isoprenylcysteine carboxyl methyltransferase family protein n=1 Tax=Ornithinimicrobium pratense TaxID=2593973 RepID=A0A5J6V9J4_9MICO|nr:isoprenylcysteine carboxyl methyltransferase family protein [Ornithinimicrobium pratense]QFG70177.1 isoprenylcysteine carboxyl methyltransferase family protein [Ornithinimicrobium pratense]